MEFSAGRSLDSEPLTSAPAAPEEKPAKGTRGGGGFSAKGTGTLLNSRVHSYSSDGGKMTGSMEPQARACSEVSTRCSWMRAEHPQEALRSPMKQPWVAVSVLCSRVTLYPVTPSAMRDILQGRQV